MFPQEKAAGGGAKWSHRFKFQTSEFRDEFKNPPNSPYVSGAAHFGLWWMIGHPVHTTLIFALLIIIG